MNPAGGAGQAAGMKLEGPPHDRGAFQVALTDRRSSSSSSSSPSHAIVPRSCWLAAQHTFFRSVSGVSNPTQYWRLGP